MSRRVTSSNASCSDAQRRRFPSAGPARYNKPIDSQNATPLHEATGK